MQVQRLVSSIGDLPATPKIVSQVIELTNSSTSSITEISELIEQDVGLSAKILEVSNSSLYGLSQVIGTLKLALVVLGVIEVRNIVMSIKVMDTFSNTFHEDSFDQTKFMSHSSSVASYSKKISSSLGLSYHGEDYLAGLLHDIGKLVLWNKIPNEYKEIVELSNRQNVKIHEIEQSKLGYNHAEIAYELAMKWCLPKSMAGALLTHHSNEELILGEMEDPKLCAIVQIANLITYDNFSDENVDLNLLLSCQDSQAWEIISTEKALSTVNERYDFLSQIFKE